MIRPRTEMSSSDNFSDFSLSSICWGYRDIFKQTIQRLFDEGYLGPEREEITSQFFALMRCSEQSLYDHVLKEFLDSLTGDTAWIFDLPAIFCEIIRTGGQFAEAKMFYGIEFYRILKNGGFGDGPEKVQFLLTWLKKLKAIDIELAFAFLNGYQRMLSRLRVSEIELFAEEGIRLFRLNTQNGIRFMEGKLAGAEAYFVQLTRECRLADAWPVMRRLILALGEHDVEISTLSELDTDELLERYSTMVCLDRSVYLPERIRLFPERRANRKWYMLQAVVTAGMYLHRSFPLIHGRTGYSNLVECVGGSICRANVIAIIEYIRVLSGCMAQWPGSKSLILHGIHSQVRIAEMSEKGGGPGDLLYRLAGYAFEDRSEASDSRDFFNTLLNLIEQSPNILGTIRGITPELEAMARSSQFELGNRPIEPISFLPDFFYPVHDGRIADTDGDSLVADLNEEAGFGDQAAEEPADVSTEEYDSVQDGGEETSEEAVAAVFLYDEWSNDEGDYFRDHCHVHEMKSRDASDVVVPENAAEQVARVRRVFELLRPEVISKLKRLSEGDEINHDLLVQYLVESERDPSPKIDFYERPYIVKRDLSVLILLDVSGSTEEEVGGQKILAIEKNAALILGQGLASLGDRFAICGFSGNGREQCHFFIYKDFYEDWGDEAIGNLYGAHSASSTRIGAALRHAGHKIRLETSKQRLIILVTDGRPMDQGYDPETRYAQYDVRMACEENRKASIHTYCISTMENTRGDMEIMFPERRFSILRDLRHLPKVLPELYIRLTT